MKTSVIKKQTWIALGLIAVALLSIVYVLAWAPPTPTADPGSPPEATNDTVRLPARGMPVEFHVGDNDGDPDQDLDPLSVVVSSPPGKGTTTVNLDGSIVYSPGQAYDGEDRFSYEICDSGGLCDRADVNVADRMVLATGQTVRFAVFGDYGDGSDGALEVAALVAELNPDFIVTTRDNSYDNADYETNVGQLYSEYIGAYQGRFGAGSDTNRFFPSLGDHEYSDGGIEPYLDYFTLPGDGVRSTLTSGNERYYDFTIGPVHVFILNVQPQEPDGSTRSSMQAEWLQRTMAESTSAWRLVVSPVPPFSSGDNHGSEPRVQWAYDRWGADAVFSGDDHVYERIVLDGIPYFVSGLGGRSMYGFAEPVAGSEYRYNQSYGVLMVEACDRHLAFAFHSLTDGVIDRFEIGDESCPRGGPLS
jgi:hypothetical protein